MKPSIFYLKRIEWKKSFGWEFWQGFLAKKPPELFVQVPQLFVAKGTMMNSIDVYVVAL